MRKQKIEKPLPPMPIFYMVNVRMRRVEQIRPHPTRFDTGRANGYKCYTGTRMWILADSEVYQDEESAYGALLAALGRLWLDRDTKQKKLHSEIVMLRAELNKLLES